MLSSSSFYSGKSWWTRCQRCFRWYFSIRQQVGFTWLWLHVLSNSRSGASELSALGFLHEGPTGKGGQRETAIPAYTGADL